MTRFLPASLFAIVIAGAFSANAAAQGVRYSEDWKKHPDHGYYYKTCYLPKGGYQYLIFYKNDPNWIHWFNPKGGADKKGVYWCKCPTVNHPDFGVAIRK